MRAKLFLSMLIFTVGLLGPAAAGAEDRTIELLTGNGAATPATFFDSRVNGSRTFFGTEESLPGTGDEDALFDVYQAHNGAVTLLTGSNPVGSGGAFAQFKNASADGTRVFFQTTESIPGTDDSDGLLDLYQAQGGVITLLSGSNPVGTGGHPISDTEIRASSDGSRVFFETPESIPGTGDVEDPVLRDIYQVQGGLITLLTGNNPAGDSVDGLRGLSSDGTRVIFETEEDIPGIDTDDITDLHQAHAGAITLLTGNNPVGTNGQPTNGFNAVSSDGTRVIFTTPEDMPGTPDADGHQDVYQAQGGVITLLSGNNPDASPSGGVTFDGASSDATRVFFSTSTNIVGSGDTDTLNDVYQAQGGAITLLSGNNPAGSGANFKGSSADGTRVFFESNENLPGTGDVDALTDIYRAQGGAISLLTGNNPGGSGGFGAFFEGSSSDGTRVFFETTEAVQGSGDTDENIDVHQAMGGTVNLISANSAGGQNSEFSGTAPDGSRVFFTTTEDVPGSGDTDGVQDVYQSRLLPLPPGPGAGPPVSGPTGRRAAALKKCKKKKRKARAKCRKKAKQLPV